MVIANFIAGSEEKFVSLMNKKAQKLGMNNTTFNNCHGLDEVTKNYSTAYDMALLSIYANKNPFYKKVTSTKYYRVQTETKSYAWTNRNKMVFTYDYFVSGKTGYTPSAGKTFVSSAVKNQLNLTIVTLNDDDHYNHHQALYEKMFNSYQNYKIVNANTFPIKKKINNKKAYLKNNLTYPIKEGEKDDIRVKIMVKKKTNNVIGEIKAYFKDREIGSIPIYEEVSSVRAKISFWQRIKNWWKNLFS